jgi:hypothetical protein
MRTERPNLTGGDLAQLYARGLLPSAPDDPGELVEAEFGPVGTAGDYQPPAEDCIEAFCEAWGTAGFCPDNPILRRR